MLDRIKNINQSKSYNGGAGARSSDFAKYFPKPNSPELLGKDSLKFSPAAVYLSRLKWHLHNIEYTGAERILLDFYIKDLEFITEFDFTNFYTEPQQLINVIDCTNFGAKQNSNIAKISYTKNELDINSELGRNSIENIEELFSRIEQLKISEDKKDIDSFFLKELIRDIENKLELEFKHILNQMHTFVYKLNKFNLKQDYTFENSGSTLLTVKEISTIYG